jgi:uncharacterized Ntn-hydrolase superfamily protein
MTYSIVARDPVTGQLGVAVQTCMFAVGATVPWARAGVGAVATQAIAERAYGPRCLDALAGGADASEALARAQSADPVPDLRQVAVVGADNSTAAATGSLCIDHAGHLVGDGFVAAANMMSTPEVWPAMAGAFADATGPLARRLLAGLVAAESVGGDARGSMSAALVVVAGELSDEPGGGTTVDLRVDRSPDPIGELTRLLDAADAFAGFDRAVDALFGGDPAAALGEVDTALRILPDDANLRFVRSGALVASGALDDGLSELRALVAERPSWAVIIRSFGAKGLINLPEGLDIDAVLG